MMIATIVLLDGRPVLPLPSHALDALRPGQRVRVTMQPLTPCVESDGTPL